MQRSLPPCRTTAACVVALATLLTLSTAIDAKAQLTRGSITGVVTDGSGAAAPDTSVKISHQATGIGQESSTNSAGIYRFAALEPGLYKIVFEKPGFETHQTTILVTTAQEATINRELIFSEVISAVKVFDDPSSGLSKSTPNVWMNLSSRITVEIPMMDSGALIAEGTRVFLMAPGVARTPGQNGYSVGGQRTRNLNVTLDGGDFNESTVSLPAAEIALEAIREIQLQVATFSAENGRNTGGQFNLVTKSGSNAFEATLWDYYTANWLQPVSLANKRANINATPRFVQNRMGGDLGGPIIKDRTFFYTLVQANVRREAPNAGNATPAIIPTPNGYQALLTAPLRSGQSTASRQAVLAALAFLPDVHAGLAARCDISNPLCAYGTASNVAVNSTPIEMGSILIPLARPANVWDVLGRIDHLITPDDRLYVRYNLNHRDQPDTSSNLQFGTRWSGGTRIPSHSAGVSYIKILGAHFVNESRLNFHRVTGGFVERDPISSTINLTNLFLIGGKSNFPQSRQEDVYQWQNTSTLHHERQTFKFGVDIRRNILFNNNAPDSKGTWTFATLQDFLNNTGSLTQAVSAASLFTAKQWNHYYFFQDDVKATRDLTVNLGIRYEASTVPFGMFGATLPEALAVGVQPPAQLDKNNWAPRIGFAYSPSNPSGILESLLGPGRTVIRGGFGVSYDILFYNILALTASTAYPRTITQTDNGQVDVFPTLLPKTATAAAINPLTTFVNTPPDIQNPTTHYWSLSVQRQVGKHYTWEAGYLGSRSYHLLRQNQGNPAVLTQAQADAVIAANNSGVIPSVQNRRVNPAWASRQLIEATGKGEYHAGYIRVEKKFSHGLLFGANYTYSANHSDSEEVTADGTISTSSPQVPQDFGNMRREWSRSIFDRPHRFSAHYIYEIPWFSGSSLMLRQIFGGWQVAGFTEFQSGQPFTIRVGVDAPGNSASASFPPGRPNYNPGGILILDPVTKDMRTFSIPCNGTGIVVAPRNTGAANCAGSFLANSMPGGGTLGRNTFRGPSFQNWNLSLMKRITLTGERVLEIRSDFINALNHNNFGIPDPVMNSATFGSNTGALVSDQRQIILTGKLKL